MGALRWSVDQAEGRPPHQGYGRPADAVRRLCGWRGASGRRYLASLYPIDRDAPQLGLPNCRSFVLLVVASTPTGRRIKDVLILDRADDLSEPARRALASEADEWHVHLPTDHIADHGGVAADLRARLI